MGISGHWSGRLSARPSQQPRNTRARLGSLLGIRACCALALGVVALPSTARAASPRQQPQSCGASTSAGARSAVAAVNRAGAQIALNISQGAAGSKIVAQGTGWPASAQVTLAVEQNGQPIFGGWSVVRAVAAADGTFVAPPFSAPGQTCGLSSQPGAVIQIVGRTADGTVVASASFTYIASPPSLAPASPAEAIFPDATSLPVTGTEWDASTLVTLWPATPGAPADPRDPLQWQPPAGAPSTQVRADAQGAFSAQVPVPPESGPMRPGTLVTVLASATSARYGMLVTTLPVPFMVRPPIAPALTLSRTQGAAGALIGVTGDHWWPGDTVRIAYCRSTIPTANGLYCHPYASQALGTATVDGAGGFRGQVALPTNARTGPITVEAYVGTGWFGGPYLVTRPFQVVAEPVPWNVAHPRLARALPLLVGAMLALAGILAALWLLSRRGRPQRA